MGAMRDQRQSPSALSGSNSHLTWTTARPNGVVGRDAGKRRDGAPWIASDHVAGRLIVYFGFDWDDVPLPDRFLIEGGIGREFSYVHYHETD